MTGRLGRVAEPRWLAFVGLEDEHCSDALLTGSWDTARGWPVQRLEEFRDDDCPDSRRGTEMLQDGIDEERKAWARLVRATRLDYGPTICAAQQALRDLGVDVDALLEER